MRKNKKNIKVNVVRLDLPTNSSWNLELKTHPESRHAEDNHTLQKPPYVIYKSQGHSQLAFPNRSPEAPEPAAGMTSQVKC